MEAGNNEEGSNQTTVSPLKPLRTSISKIVSGLMTLAGISALLTILGFFAIHSYLASFTALSSYNVHITQYIATGINLFLFTSIFTLIVVVPGLVVGYSLAYALKVLGNLLSRNSRISDFLSKFSHKILQVSHRNIALIYIIHKVATVILIGVIAWTVILLIVGYGRIVYPLMPRYIGGGMPSNIVLIFRESQSETDFGWPFKISTTNEYQSESVQLLMEFTDGILVRSTNQDIPVIIKHDQIRAVLQAP